MQQALRRTGGDSAVTMIHIVVEPAVRANKEVLMGGNETFEAPSPYCPEYRGRKGVRPRMHMNDRRFWVKLLEQIIQRRFRSSVPDALDSTRDATVQNIALPAINAYDSRFDQSRIGISQR